MTITDLVQSRLANMTIGNTITKTNTDNTVSSDGNQLSFIDTLKQKLDEVNNKQLQADADTESLIKGDDIDIHQVMLSQEEAKLSLQLAVQVRNKLVDAYQELNRLQL